MGSLWIGRYFKIDVFIHWTFWLLPIFVALRPGPETLLNVVVVFGAFGCILLHEFGHALAARGFGIATRNITLYPIGGVARLDGMGDRWWKEFWITAAGPAVNVVIATLLLVPSVLLFLANPRWLAPGCRTISRLRL